MSRIKLKFPKKEIFNTIINVRIQDINYGGHLGNDAVLGLMHEARMQWFKSLGYANEVVIANRTGIIITEVAIQYKAEAFHGDRLTFQLAITDISTVGFDIYYQVTNCDTDKLTAMGKTGVVFFDYEKRKITNIPADFLTKIDHGQ